MKRFTPIFYTLVALGVLYSANRMDQRHFETAQHTLNSIYDDRVVAQEIIYHLSSVFNDRHLQYITDTAVSPNDAVLMKQNKLIDNLIIQFKKTSLTENEKFQLDQFLVNYNKLLEYETSIETGSTPSLANIKNAFFIINENLDQLTRIQVSESKNLKAIGQKSLDSNYLLSMTEIALMVVMVVVILIFSFYKGFK